MASRSVLDGDEPSLTQGSTATVRSAEVAEGGRSAVATNIRPGRRRLDTSEASSTKRRCEVSRSCSRVGRGSTPRGKTIWGRRQALAE